jgi:hypothetical protein
MIEYVSLEQQRNRGWPWPESSFGLDAMFGEDGWCRECGVPRHPQTGSLVLERKAMRPSGVWVPNWRFDVICLERPLGVELQKSFRIDLRDVGWHGDPPGEASQIVAPVVGDAWFSPDELRTRATVRNGYPGETCAECGVWKWSPIPREFLPVVKRPEALDQFDVAASPEWFGAGRKAFRLVVLRRQLAEALQAASPRDVRVAELSWDNG